MMNPHQKTNQNPPSASAVQQVNPVTNQQMFNGNVGPVFPNNMPIVAAPGFMNFPNQFPNGIGGFNPQQNFIPFPVNQFNPSQQQPGQNFMAYRPNVGLQGQQQALVQNTIQNISQLLQLQNSNYAQCFPSNFPMFPNPMMNVMNPQNPGFVMNQQFGMPSGNGPMQNGAHGPQNMGPQMQGGPFLPSANGSVQTQQPQNIPMIQNQIPQGAGPQNQNFFTNQMFGMTNVSTPMQNDSQGPPGFSSPMMVNMGQTNSTNVEDNNKNGPTNANGGWNESQQKNFTGHKAYDQSHKGFKFNKHVKQKFGNYKGNISKDGDSNLEVDAVSRNVTDFEKKVPALIYTEHEIKEWREARKKNYPTSGTLSEKLKKEHTLSDVTNQGAVLRRQCFVLRQLKEILAKQAELGCEVADISGSYNFLLESSPKKQNPRDRKHERQQHYKRGKFHNKRGAHFQDVDRYAKKSRSRDQHSFKPNHETKPKKREPSLLEKLLTPDIKRDKTHLLQVLRFMTANSFFTEESLRFPPVIVRETNVDAASQETTCSVVKEINVDVPTKETTCTVVKETNVDVMSKDACSVVKAEEEEGEIID
ncbi:uncharacterized protein LOC143551657 [Bidens hawaiensis]|uniref:uncharacterized protein LOC143551657 n=1 Tax=Bidens hawaiensis TaxID=980011 RepID=UPI00404A5E49